MFYSGQIVLPVTLEYVSLPVDCYVDLLTRSSYNRLDLQINTMFQPVYRGCLSAELFNHGNSAVELVVGSRIFQARFSSSVPLHNTKTLALASILATSALCRLR